MGGAEDTADGIGQNPAQTGSQCANLHDRKQAEDKKKSGSTLKNALRVVFCVLFVLLAVFVLYSRHVALER